MTTERSAICCPHCGAIESISTVVCHRCGKIIRKVAEATPVNTFFQREDALVKILQGAYSIAFVLILAVTIRHGGTPLEAIIPDDAFERSMRELGSLFGPAVIRNGEWYRLLTATFLHAGLLHLFFNSMALGAIGPEAEKNLGGWRFLATYFVAGVVANAASLLWHGGAINQVGASGAICGLMGALYSIARMRGGVYDQVVRRIVTRWIVMTVVFGLLIPFTDNAAHITGIIVGAVMARVLGLKKTVWVV